MDSNTLVTSIFCTNVNYATSLLYPKLCQYNGFSTEL